jgi:hypothetical protein
VIGQRLPDAGDRRLQLNGFFDAVGHAQPPGCLST